MLRTALFVVVKHRNQSKVCGDNSCCYYSASEMSRLLGHASVFLMLIATCARKAEEQKKKRKSRRLWTPFPQKFRITLKLT